MNPTNKMCPIHAGEILREEFLVPLGISAHALAMELNVPAPRINDIVRERRSITQLPKQPSPHALRWCGQVIHEPVCSADLWGGSMSQNQTVTRHITPELQTSG